jgi:hypothetical protein
VRKTYTAGSRSIDIADPTNAAQGYIYINFPIKNKCRCCWLNSTFVDTDFILFRFQMHI